jgi:hypothetical protein
LHRLGVAGCTCRESKATYRLNIRGDGIPDNTGDVTALLGSILPEAVRILRVPFRGFGPIFWIDESSVVDDGGTSPADTQVLTIQSPITHGSRTPNAWLDLQLATDVDEFAAVRRLSDNY